MNELVTGAARARILAAFAAVYAKISSTQLATPLSPAAAAKVGAMALEKMEGALRAADLHAPDDEAEFFASWDQLVARKGWAPAPKDTRSHWLLPISVNGGPVNLREQAGVMNPGGPAAGGMARHNCRSTGDHRPGSGTGAHWASRGDRHGHCPVGWDGGAYEEADARHAPSPTVSVTSPSLPSSACPCGRGAGTGRSLVGEQ